MRAIDVMVTDVVTVHPETDAAEVVGKASELPESRTYPNKSASPVID
jgi:CBS domain-containing protein